ncbi:hypothetical protein IB234_14345 [Pseudomonas sp. PDM16]|uniref:globin domain-containing protein n=1 Tax=Pseudomonas sp. PDM16 TaxID=2769292 RepID=UPI0017806F6C|nr:globin domain-containing protein [Pseudomonas sp. PDM16]MBD9415738.1 hypothetical protein [Pseudomonas sp. PDM16]
MSTALDAPAAGLIKQSAPLLRQHGAAINRRLYDTLAQHYPSAYALLERTDFPPLASVVASYAASVDNLEPFLRHAPKIARVHQHIGLQEAHFDMLGSALQDALKTVLADLAPPAALAAWAEAYRQLAVILIRLQRELPALPAPTPSE